MKKFNMLYTLGLLLMCISLWPGLAYAQDSLNRAEQRAEAPVSFWQPAPTYQPKRAKLAGYTVGGGLALTYTYLATSWYSDQELGAWRWFDDSRQWQGMDKVGHAYGAYQGSRLIMSLMEWAGYERKHVLLWGGLSGFVMQLPIEVMDGFAEDYGASATDLVANGLGAGLAMGNYALWGEQRIQLKFSFSPSPWAAQRPDLLGDGISEIVKDYNGQTYWLTCSLGAFLPKESGYNRAVPWLGFAVGYGAEGLLGGYEGAPTPEIRARERQQVYLSLDIDLSRIRTQSGFLRTVFTALNAIRVPLPTLELGGGKPQFHWLHF